MEKYFSHSKTQCTAEVQKIVRTRKPLLIHWFVFYGLGLSSQVAEQGREA